jgi:fluoroquinolone transport system permease protein
MQRTTSFRRLAAQDTRLIGRDSFLLYLFAYITLIAVALRYLLPYLNARIAATGLLAHPLSDWYPMLVAYFLIFLGAALVGMIFGFVLLEEKDDNTLKALLVTPLPLRRYVAYRVTISMALAFVEVIMSVWITNVAVPPLGQLAILAAGASLSAPITALYFAALAENKVQGLALTKFTGIAGFLIPLAWFTPGPLQFLFGLFPPYWISKAYWLALAGSPWWLAAWTLGVLLQAGLIVLLTRRFHQAAYQ